MEEETSLRQTVTHLFDAVRHGRRVHDLGETAKKAESEHQSDLAKLERLSEELSKFISSMKHDPQDPIKELSRQLDEFFEVARSQARAKLERQAKDERERVISQVSSERDKAIQSLEAYLATTPLPVVDSSVKVRLVHGSYVAEAGYECEGGVKYQFGLATQNSKLLHQEFFISQLGQELRVPVRFSKTLLKGRVPGFERLDQYLLKDAEYSNGKMRANFKRPGDEATIKVVTSGFEKKDFVGLEFADKRGTVNVMNDLSLAAHADLEGLKSVLAELAKEMKELATNKVTLQKLSLEGEDLLQSLDCFGLLQKVMSVLGTTYRSMIEKMPEVPPAGSPAEGLSVRFIQERVHSLGEFSEPVSHVLGIRDQGAI